jgi:hypothetical protein
MILLWIFKKNPAGTQKHPIGPGGQKNFQDHTPSRRDFSSRTLLVIAPYSRRRITLNSGLNSAFFALVASRIGKNGQSEPC